MSETLSALLLSLSALVSSISGGIQALNAISPKTQVAQVVSSGTGSTIRTFSITEQFGVSHPDQIIDFDYPGASSLNPNSTCILGPNGNQVPYQILSGNKIAVRTNLPANTTKVWSLQSGCTPSFSSQLVLDTSNPNYYQITNGITGVKVFKANNQTRAVSISSVSVVNNVATFTSVGNHKLETVVLDSRMPSAKLPITISGFTGSCSYLNDTTHQVYEGGDTWNPSNNKFKVRNISGADCSDTSGGTITLVDTIQSPILSVQLQDGNWTDGRGAELRNQDGYGYFNNRVLNAKTVQSQILENGPLKVVIKVTYSYNRPTRTYNEERACSTAGLGSAPCTSPGGNGYYTSILTLEAGQNSILIEDSTDMDLRYAINFSNAVDITQGRYRGHSAGSTAFGYLADGSVCGGFDSRAKEDCFRDFNPAMTLYPSYNASGSSVPPISAWNPWSNGTGAYWMLYNKDAAGISPVVGAFAGSASKAVGAHLTGPAPYIIQSDETGQKQNGFEFMTYRKGPDATVSLRSTMSWGLFIGTKSADLAPSTVTQNINKQMNLYGGFNLNKIHRYILEFNDPIGGYGRLFNEPTLIQSIIAKLRNGPDKTGYFNYLYNTEPTARGLIDLWNDAGGAKTRMAVTNTNNLSKSMLNAFVNGDGIYDFKYHYWHGGLEMARQIPFMDSILADPSLSAADKKAVKANAALYSYILYDDDFVPLSNYKETRLGLGTANMSIQQSGYKDQFALFMPLHPLLSANSANVAAGALGKFKNQVNAAGASACSPHYTGACVEATLISMLQGMMVGTDQFAADMSRTTRFGEFLMQLLTPPEVRFRMTTSTYVPVSVPRKMVAEGDGATEGTEMTGIMAQGFRTTNPTLASRLMGAWNAGGKVHSGFFSTTLAIINENAPSQDPNLGSDNFSGYMSVLRNGWNTDQENALWLFNGDWLSQTGHRHDDRGSVVLYALKAPLTVNWGSIYTPSTAGGNMASMVIPEANFSPVGWNQDNQKLNQQSGWTSSTNNIFQTFNNSSLANAKMAHGSGLNWERKLYSITPNPTLPIIMIKDTFSGNNASAGKVMTLNLMATGAVSTPAGLVIPPVRLETVVNNGTHTILPSVSPTITLNTGANKFSFTGQTWSKHPTGGIDWDLYTIADEAQQAVIGNWGHSSAPSSEQTQYRNANNTNFTESQHILRVRGSNNFWTLVLPYNKGQKPAGMKVTQDVNGDVVIERTGEVIRVNESMYSFKSASKVILTSFDTSGVSDAGITISGGPTEVVQTSSVTAITFSGSQGTRTITLPGTWSTSGGLSKSGNTYTYNYQSSVPVTVALSGSVALATSSTPISTTAPSTPSTQTQTQNQQTQTQVLTQAQTTPQTLGVENTYVPINQQTVFSSPGGLTLTLFGNNPAYIMRGNVYSDPGIMVTETDDFIFKIRARVNGKDMGTIDDVQINTRVVGTSTIEYAVTDSVGKTGQATRTVVVQSDIPATQLQLNTLPSVTSIPLISRTVSIGSEGTDVINLQKFLISKGHLSADTSPLGYFGSATREAVKKYQCAAASICSGDESTTGYGMAGQKTRALINASVGSVSSGTFSLAPLSVSNSSEDSRTKGLMEQIASLVKLVASLQEQLAKLKR